MQELIEQQTTTVRTDKQGRRELAGRIYDSNGVLNDDRARSTTIADYRRTTDAITRATAKFRSDAKQSYERIVGTVKGNREHTQQLTADTKVISDNTEAISRSTTRYNEVHRADEWKSSRDEQNYNQQRRSAGENLKGTAFSLVTNDQSSAELARNFRDIEANIVQMKERQKEMEKPQPKKSRGMDFGM